MALDFQRTVLNLEDGGLKVRTSPHTWSYVSQNIF